MERYIGLDAHAASCTLAVVSQAGRRLRDFSVELRLGRPLPVSRPARSCTLRQVTPAIRIVLPSLKPMWSVPDRFQSLTLRAAEAMACCTRSRGNRTIPSGEILHPAPENGSSARLFGSNFTPTSPRSWKVASITFSTSASPSTLYGAAAPPFDLASVTSDPPLIVGYGVPSQPQTRLTASAALHIAASMKQPPKMSLTKETPCRSLALSLKSRTFR
jgi:hypothetical protein